MIVALIGTPSPLTYIATNLLRAVVQVSCGEHDMLGVNDVPDLRAAWPQRDARRPAVVIASDMPRPDFVEFLLAAKVPTLLCLERLDEIDAYMIACRGIDAASALRVATHSLSVLEPLAVETPPAVLKMGVFQTTLAQTLADLLRFCNEEADEAIVEAALRYLGFAGRGEIDFAQFLFETRRALFPDLGADLKLAPGEIDALRVVAASYNAVAEGAGLAQAVWPAFWFVQADTPGLPADADIELEGRARFLSHGPYFHLPAGLWAAEVAIEVNESLSQNRVGFDVYCGAVAAACTTTLPAEGALACDLAFRVSDPTAPVEIRIQLLSGAIEGRLRLEGVTLRRL